MEYKYIPKIPKRSSTRLKANLSELQYIWLTERQKQGVACIVILGTPHGGVIIDNFDNAKEGITRAEFLDTVLSPKELAYAILDSCQGRTNEDSNDI